MPPNYSAQLSSHLVNIIQQIRLILHQLADFRGNAVQVSDPQLVEQRVAFGSPGMLQCGLNLDFAFGFANACVHQNNEMKPAISILRSGNVVFHLVEQHLKSVMAEQVAKNKCDIRQIIARDPSVGKVVQMDLEASESADLYTFLPLF